MLIVRAKPSPQLQTLHKTLCEDTVFWDLNYGMLFEALGTAEIMDKALAVRSILSFNYYLIGIGSISARKKSSLFSAV